MTTHATTAHPIAAAYERDGFVLAKGVFTPAECDALIAHMMDVAHGRAAIPNFTAPDTTKPHWGRTHNQHLHDPIALSWLLSPKLKPLVEAINDGNPVEGIQTMYFWQGSVQPRHQDQYYLPGCFSAWCALMDVGPDNGTLLVQPGSHSRRLIRLEDLPRKPDGALADMFGSHYDNAVDQLFVDNNLPEVPVLAQKGDVLLFHGRLIHRGGPIGKPGSFRHVMANHYISADFAGWPHEGWPRYAFDGSKRQTTPPKPGP